MAKFLVEAEIGDLPPEVVAKIVDAALSFYMEEHYVESFKEVAALDDYEWAFSMKPIGAA